MDEKSTKGRKVKVAETTLTVRRQFTKPASETTEQDETISVREFSVEPAKVVLEKGLTINLGNYESARITLAITVPCYFEELAEAYDFANDFVLKRLEAEKTDIRESRKHSEDLLQGGSSTSNPF